MAAVSNPCVEVRLEHPPSLVTVEKAVLAPVAKAPCAEAVARSLRNRFIAHRVDVIDSATLVRELARNGQSLETFIAPAEATAIAEVTGPGTLLIVREDRCDVARREYSRRETRSRRIRARGSARSDSASVGASRSISGTRSGSSESASRARSSEDVEETYEALVYSSETEAYVSVTVQAVDPAQGHVFPPRPLELSHAAAADSESQYPAHPSESTVRSEAVGLVTYELQRWFLPYASTRRYVFCDTKSKRCNLTRAARAFKSLDFPRARELAESDARTCMDSPRKRDQSNAHYNLGVMRRIQNDCEPALESLRRASELNAERSIISNVIVEAAEAARMMRALAVPETVDRTTLPIDASAARAPPGEPDDPALRDADVLRLTQAQVPARIVIGKIAAASRWSFDLSADAIAGLVAAGVDEDVILAMMEKGSQ